MDIQLVSCEDVTVETKSGAMGAVIVIVCE